MCITKLVDSSGSQKMLTKLSNPIWRNKPDKNPKSKRKKY